MRVLVIPSWYPTEEKPVNGIFFQEQVDEFSRFGLDVTVIVPQLHEKKNGVYLSYQGNIPIYSCYFKSGKLRTMWDRAVFLNENENSLEKWIINLFKNIYKDDRFFPDVIHAHSVFIGGYVGTILKSKFCIPLVLTEHATFLTSPTKYYARDSFSFRNIISVSKNLVLHQLYVRKLVRKTYNQSSLVVCVSNFQKSLLVNEYRFTSDCVVVPNMVNRIFFDVKKQKSDRFNVLSVGVLVKRKGFDKLVEGFTEYFEDIDFRLTIVGDGIEYNPIDQLIPEKFRDRIKLVGRKNKKEICNYLVNTDLYISTSNFETFGIVSAEALAAGVPVLSFDNGGVHDIVTNDSLGRVMKNNRISELMYNAEKIRKNLDLYDTKTIQDTAFCKFHPSTVTQKYFDIFIKLSKEIDKC